MRFMLITSMLLGLGAAVQGNAAEPLRVLILSGQNNHNWQETTPFLKDMYETSGRFVVDVTNDPASLTAETLKPYDVLVDNWSAYPDMTGRQWGPAEGAILDFVRGGKGFVLLHAATACFSDWPEFQEMAGCTWGDDSGHGKFHKFEVFIDDPEHPIAKGMPPFIAGPDELYHRLTPHPSMHVVASAFSAKIKMAQVNLNPSP